MKKIILLLLIVVSCKSADTNKGTKNIKLIKNFCEDILFVNDTYYEIINIEAQKYNKNPTPKNKLRLDSISNIFYYKENKLYNKYLDINLERKKILLRDVNIYVMLFNEQLKEKKIEDYNIIPFSKVSNFPNLDSSNFTKNIKYKDKTNLYFLYSAYEKNSAFFFIVENDKIISFFPELDMRQKSESGKEITPYLLNK